MHPRRKIRDAVYQRLLGHEGLRELFNARVKFTPDVYMPFCNVITGNETSVPDDEDYYDRRTLQLFVVLYARDVDYVVNSLDDLAEVVEYQLSVDKTLGDLCVSFRYTGADPFYENVDDPEAASLTLTYECVYRWGRPFEGDEWKQTRIGFDMAQPRNDPQIPPGPDGQIDASVTIIHGGNQSES